MVSLRPGFALIFSMLLVMALAVVAMGMLAVGTREAWVAGALVRHRQAVRDAETAVAMALGTWSTKAMADMPVGGLRSQPAGDDDSTTVERIDRELYHVRGVGRVDGPDGVTRAVAAVVVRTLAPDALQAALPGALTSRATPALLGGTLAGDGGCGAPGPGVVAPAVDRSAGAVVTGAPPVLLVPPSHMPEPDAFAAATAKALATVVYRRRSATPQPGHPAAPCAPGSNNWGSPDPTHPCYPLLPVVVARTLDVRGGVGRGTLLVDGDLRLTAGFVFHGVIVVSGHLEVEGGASIHGAVRAGTATIADGAIRYDACAATAALSAPSFDGPFRDTTRWWVPAF